MEGILAPKSPVASELVTRLIALARGELGKHPYLWGAKVYSATGPLDCSGFTQWCFQQIGVEIGPGTWFQREYCHQHGRKLLSPELADAGCLLFWMDEDSETPSHVGIATGEGTVVEETASFNANVVESPVSPRWTQGFIEGWRFL